MQNGLVIVYTGNGKGKTSAALGLALRQAGQGGQVLIFQFLKSGANGGEHKALRHLPNIEIIPCGREGFIISQPQSRDYELAATALRQAKAALESGRYQMLVLDEINVATSLGLIAVSDVLELIAKRGPVHLVLTGRGAASEIIEAADIVSELIEVKHDYSTGRQALAGIEF
ncbi:MAG: cob(I)yrinic acid a,c-diamide adenosyltransferase [Firmicutes bacterium]|nr:cob(I)yrinic acid a,c-diamide adenosyltransferase [Bacillota bacterium]